MLSEDIVERRRTAARIVLALLLAVAGAWSIAEFIPALAWASILAIAFWPLYARAQRRWPPGHHNIMLPLIFTLVIALAVFAPLAFAAISVAREAHTVFDWVDHVRTEGFPVPDFVAHLPFGAAAVTDWWHQNLTEPGAAQALLHKVDRADLGLAGKRVGAELLHRGVVLIFTLVTLFFLFKDGSNLARQMRSAAANAFGPSGERVGRQIIASVHGTVDGLVLVGLGEGFLLGIGYAIAGAPRPALLGALTAVAAMIPFGAPLVFGVAAILLVMQGSVVGAVAIVILGFIVTFVADHFIRPALIGGATQLPFLWVLFGILGGVKTFGLLGLFLGPAIMAALILLWREWVDERGSGDADLSHTG